MKYHVLLPSLDLFSEDILSAIFFTNGVTIIVIGKPIANVVKKILNHIWKKCGTTPIFITVTAKEVSKDIIEPIIAPNSKV
jgi:hypothetical protein